MDPNPEHVRGTKTRFRTSLLLLVCLLLAKLWTLGGHAQSQTTVADSEQNPGFRPVAEENANVWGLAGDILSLFSGGRRSSAEIDRELNEERAQRQATDDANQRRYWKEDEERRADERDSREQEQEEYRQQKQQEQDDYDRRQQQYDDQRRQEQNY